MESLGGPTAQNTTSSLSATKLAISKVSLSTNFLGVITNRNRLYLNQRSENSNLAEFQEVMHFSTEHYQISQILCGRSMISVIATNNPKP
jgi:hypothetical protein